MAFKYDGYTYSEWQAKGFQVIKGEKASGWDGRGKALFKREQVELKNGQQKLL